VIDLIHLSHNRLEFTKASLAALQENTNWSKVGRLLLYDDNSSDGTREFVETWAREAKIGSDVELRFGTFGHPVIVMLDYLRAFQRHSIFGKIDSDTMVPPGWLDQCLDVMERHPELDLLGIEAMNPVDGSEQERGFTDARFIGGIGLMRAKAFFENPGLGPNGRYFGFTEWQERHKNVKKGWLSPSLPVFLLDRLPMEPWRSFSKEYTQKFGQREWGPYDMGMAAMWEWWRA
jgi:GT2 family glycosyltransferase